MSENQESVEEIPIVAEEEGPVPIVVVNEDHTFSLDETAIESILLKKEIAHLPIVIISVAGAFRKGKSFFLNFLLRYLNNYDDSDWLGESDQELSGFSWRGGSDRVTTGIWMWNKVFVKDLPSGEKVAVALMDTQGAFDSSSTVKDCATIFALSTMTSSMQVYNLSQNIQEDDFQHLELFTEYGRLAMEESTFKPFQSLLFLVRDWSYPYEYDYGLIGGGKLLVKRLESSEKQHFELQRVRTHIQSCFSELSCFLMPHPGLSVATNPHFKGALKDITFEFKQQLLELVPSLLAPENLKTKQINGEVVTCSALVEYFRSYMKIYDGEKLPEPKTMLEATAEANNLTAVVKARDTYTDLMDKVCGSGQPYVSPTVLEEKHREYEGLALECFDSIRKMGGDDFSERYRDKLSKDIEEDFENYVQSNSTKNVFKSIRTPCVYFTFAVVFYLLSGLFGFLYMTSLASLCYIIVLLLGTCISLWGYVQFTGQYVDVGKALETGADAIWNGALRNIYLSIFELTSQHVSQETMQQLTTKIKTS